jgi:hypothetical protein
MTDDRVGPGSRGWGRRRAADPGRSLPALTRLLRQAFATPEDPAYWERLEARIMAGVRRHASATPADHWAAAFNAWTRAGVAAAGIAALAAGLAAWSTRDTGSRVAYETVLDMPTAPVQTDTRFIDVSEQEATVRYVFSH